MKKITTTILTIMLFLNSAQAAVIDDFNIKNGRWVVEGTTNENVSSVIMSISSDDTGMLTDMREKYVENTGFSFDLPEITENGFYTIKVRDQIDDSPYERKVYLTNNKKSGVMYDSVEDDTFDVWRVKGDGTGRLLSNGKYNLGTNGNGITYAYIDGFFNAMDYSYSLSISAQSTGMNYKILFRYTDDDNYCYLNISTSKREYEMGFVKNGIDTVTWIEKMNDDEGEVSTYYDVRIECLGYEARAYVNGREAGALYDEDLDRGTIGVWAENGKVNFNNVYVKNLIDDVRVGRIKFLSESGNEIYRVPENGKMVVTAKAENISRDESFKVTLVAAVYDNDKLVEVKTNNESILPEEKKEYKIELTGVEQNQTVKAFLWDDYFSMKPLNSAKGIDKNVVKTNIFVDPDYVGISDGSYSAPYTTISDAIEKLKDIKKNTGLGDNGLGITLMGGVYEQDDTLLFSGEDMSGTLLQPVVISSYQGEEVKIKGSESLDISTAELSQDTRIPQKAKGKIYEIPLDFDVPDIELFGYSTPSSEYTNVLIDGELQQIAKYPNEGYLKTSNIYDKNGEKLTVDSEKWSSIRENENYVWLDLHNSNISNWQNAEDAYAAGYWHKYWTWGNARLLEVDRMKSRIKISVPKQSPIDSNKDFIIYNLLEELDCPGEWYIDRELKKLYIYPKDEINENTTIEVTTLTKPLINISDAHDIVVDSLAIGNTSADAVKILNSERIVINNCIVSDVGANGVFVQNSNNIKISDSDILNTGTAGIYMFLCGEMTNLTRSNNLIENCDIYKFGEVSRSYTPGVRIVGCVGVDVLNNEIHEGTHSAIVYSGSEINIKYNEIYNVLTMASDSGAIYSGRSYIDLGNEIKYNYLHDIRDNVNNEEPVVGIYMDDQLSGTTIESNILYKIDSGIFISGGRDTVVRNNIIVEKTASDYSPDADGRYAIMLRTSGLMEHRSEMVQNMIKAIDSLDLECESFKKYPNVNVYPEDNPGAPVRNIVENNVIWNHHPLKKYTDWEVWSPVGENLENAIEPDFENVSEGNLNLKEDSEVFKVLSGFEKIPFDKIGRKE